MAENRHFTDSCRDKIKETANSNIYEVVSEFVTLKRSGSGYKGLSPFQKEKSESFIVTPAKNIFKCFSSNIGGNAIKFLTENKPYADLKTGSMTFGEALEWCANKFNIPKEYKGNEKPVNPEVVKIRGVLTYAQEYFREQFESGDDMRIAYRYMTEMRFFTPYILERFKIGYAIFGLYNGLLKSARARGFNVDDLFTAGVVSKNVQDKFFDTMIGRVIFPIYDEAGNIMAFGGRKLGKKEWPAPLPDHQPKKLEDPVAEAARQEKFTAELEKTESYPKYLNTKETIIYKKSYVLYGIHLAKKAIREKNNCFVVEGYTDVMACHMSDLENTVASCGTAITTGHAKQIRKYCDNITYFLDGDLAGIKAVVNSIENVLPEGFTVHVVLLQGHKDPDSYRVATSEAALKEYATTASQDGVRFVIRERMKAIDRENPNQVASAIRKSMELIALMPDLIARQLYVTKISQDVGVTEDVLYHELNFKLRELERKKSSLKPAVTANLPQTNPPPQKDAAPQDEKQKAHLSITRTALRFITMPNGEELDRIFDDAKDVTIPDKWKPLWEAIRDNRNLENEKVFQMVQVDDEDRQYILNHDIKRDNLHELGPTREEILNPDFALTRVLANIRLKIVRSLITENNEEKRDNFGNMTESERERRMVIHLELKKIERAVLNVLKASLSR